MFYLIMEDLQHNIIYLRDLKKNLYPNTLDLQRFSQKPDCERVGGLWKKVYGS